MSTAPNAEQKSGCDAARLRSYDVGSRRVTVWTPPGYENDPDRRYPVLYLHDGQHLLAPTSEVLGWGLDAILLRMVTEEKIPPVLAVGIWNTEMRIQEYSPQKAFDRFFTPEQMDSIIKTGFCPLSEPYLDFWLRELKPHVDATYRTLPDRAHTFTMGASMGGMISIYALCEHPGVFGGAICMSTHWPIGGGAMVPYLRQHPPDPRTHRLYFDHGTVDVEGQYTEFQQQVDAILLQAGFRAETNWITRVHLGHDHGEACWSSRVELPLTFVLRTAG